MSVYKDLNAITSVALHYAKEHNVNYNITIHNAINDQFDPKESTYEFVADSYFEKDRPNCVIVDTTDDINERLKTEEDEKQPDPFILQGDEFLDLKNITQQDPHKYIEELLGEFRNSPGVTIYRDAPKVQNNESCTCGSGKKYKKCCK